MLRPAAAVAVLLCLVLPARRAGAEGGSGGPNLVLIVSDDAGYADFGFHGSTEIFTPHIDALARTGVVFTNGYVTGAVCAPSRAGLMTGRHPARFGYNENNLAHSIPAPGFFAEDMGLPRFERTLADELRDLGYHTGLVGKWHLGDRHQDYHPQQRGFDDFYGLLGGWTYYFERSRLDRANRLMRGEEIVDDEGHVTDLLGQEACAYIEARHARGERFFLTLSFTAPHSPLEATADDLLANAGTDYAESWGGFSPEQRRTYAAMQTALDRNVHAVTQQLERLGLLDHTLLVFINDNGGPTDDNASRNDPLRGGKGSSWEGGLRVPSFLSWPGRIEGGRRYHPVVSALDIFPTFVRAAGARLADNLDGVDLLPFLTGQAEGEPHPELFWPGTARAAARSGRWKAHLDTGQLYDLVEDIGETNDLGAAHPGVYDRLHQGWKALNESETEPTRWWWSQWSVDQRCDEGARPFECEAIDQVRYVFNNLTRSGRSTGRERIDSFTLMDRALSRGVTEDDEAGTLALEAREAAAVFRFHNFSGTALDGVTLTLVASPGAAFEVHLDDRKVGLVDGAASGPGWEELSLEIDLPRGPFRIRLQPAESGTPAPRLKSMTLSTVTPRG